MKVNYVQGTVEKIKVIGLIPIFSIKKRKEIYIWNRVCTHF